MAPCVSTIGQLKSLAKIKFKKESGKYAKLSDAQEALARELNYRDWFHAMQSLREVGGCRGVIGDRPWCYWWCGEYDEVGGKRLLIPSMVIKDEPGHYPMRGGDLALPWYWGETEREIEDACDQMNRSYGLTKEQVCDIVASSIRAQNLKSQGVAD